MSSRRAQACLSLAVIMCCQALVEGQPMWAEIAEKMGASRRSNATGGGQTKVTQCWVTPNQALQDQSFDYDLGACPSSGDKCVKMTSGPTVIYRCLSSMAEINAVVDCAQSGSNFQWYGSSWKLECCTGNGCNAPTIDVCLSMTTYTKLQARDWLRMNFKDKVKASYDGEMDGRALAQFAESTDSLSTTSMLLSIVPPAHLPSLVTAIKIAKSHSYLSLPPAIDPCSRLFKSAQGTEVEVSAVVEKVLSLDTDAYTFEIVFSLSLFWDEDRVRLVPLATADEMDRCPKDFHCGWCDFTKVGPSDVCVPDMRGYPQFTNPRDAKNPRPGYTSSAGRNKCCEELWHPLREDPSEGIIFPNAKEIEVLEQAGPTFFDLGPPPDGVERPSWSFGMGYALRRMRGVFYIPMNFKLFPNDKQNLDIHITTNAKKDVVNMTNGSNANASGYYVAGGATLPTSEKERLGLANPSNCPEQLEGATQSLYEDLSGWSISKTVEVLSFTADDRDCTWFSPCNISYPSTPVDKIRSIKPLVLARFYETWAIMMGYKWEPWGPHSFTVNKPGETFNPYNTTQPQSLLQSFVVLRINVCRRPDYFIENVVIVIVLLNAVNVLSLLLSPRSVESRLASCGTMVLALAAMQAFVAEDTPRAGYQTNGQMFMKVSNMMMIAAGLESVLVYIACEKNWSVLRFFCCKWDPEGLLVEAEMHMWDHLFIIVYAVCYMVTVDALFPPLKFIIVPSLVVLGIIFVITLVFWVHRLRTSAAIVVRQSTDAPKHCNEDLTQPPQQCQGPPHDSQLESPVRTDEVELSSVPLDNSSTSAELGTIDPILGKGGGGSRAPPQEGQHSW